MASPFYASRCLLQKIVVIILFVAIREYILFNEVQNRGDPLFKIEMALIFNFELFELFLHRVIVALCCFVIANLLQSLVEQL